MTEQLSEKEKLSILDSAIMECSGIKKEHMETIQKDNSWNNNRICFLKISVQHLWVNNILPSKNEYTQIIYESMQNYIKTGIII